jgi:peptidoglycan hydrolase-like protein with peptidoglycan-binding domain
MDTLAYTHLASAYEAPREAQDGSLVLFRGMKWTNTCLIPVLSAAIGFAVLSTGQSAQAALYYGDYGHDVKDVQHKLAYYGYFHAHATGYYGKITKHAVKAFQYDHGLYADGVVGHKTADALGLSCQKSCYKSSYYEKKPSYEYKKASYDHKPKYHGYSHGYYGKEVAKLQKKLAYHGYFHAKATGYYGHITKHAVKAFQYDHGLYADGIVGPKTLHALGLH